MVFFCITPPRATSERLPVSRSSSRRRRGRSVRVYRAPRRGRRRSERLARRLARSRRVRPIRRRRSCSKTYAAASLGFAGHDAPGSPCDSAFFAARRKRVTTSSTSRGSRVAHASTSHDRRRGAALRRAHRALVEVFTHRRQEEKFRVRRLPYDERSVQLCIITRVARCRVSLGRAPSDRAQKLIGCHSRARWGRADGKHGGGDALPRQVRSGVHRGVYSPKMFFSPAAARVGRRRRPTVASTPSFASTSSLTRAVPPAPHPRITRAPHRSRGYSATLLYTPRRPYAALRASRVPNVEASFGDETRLILYALQSQAERGPCEPRSKWGMAAEDRAAPTWANLGKMEPFEAMRLFVKLLDDERPGWWKEDGRAGRRHERERSGGSRRRCRDGHATRRGDARDRVAGTRGREESLKGAGERAAPGGDDSRDDDDDEKETPGYRT